MNAKRVLSIVLCIMMVAACVLPLVACGGDPSTETPCAAHIDGNKDGKCDNCDASVTTVCTTHVDANKDGKCDNCNQEVEVVPAGQSNYTVSVKTIGGMPLVGVNVFIYDSEDKIVAMPKSTNDKGVVTFTLKTASDYSVYLDGVPEGYNVKTGDTADARYPMGPTGAQIILSSKPVTEGTLKNSYSLGDVMYDFSVTDVNGTTYKLSEILETKKMVMLNFWYIECSWCNKEFPGLNDAYVNYQDKLEILAINDYKRDTLNEVKSFPTTGTYKDDNLVMPMFKITDTKSLTIGKFGNSGYPTTVIIDRYGVVSMIESGAIVGEAKWNKIFNHFTSDDYTQMLVEKAEDLTPPEIPDVEWIGSDAIAENLSSGITATYAPDKDEYSWNFLPLEVEGIKVVAPTNKSDNSYGILYAYIELLPGQAVMFDYFSSCEYSNDRMVIIVDGDDICSLTGRNSGSVANLQDWEQCCAFVDPRPVTPDNANETATYELAFVYLKDTEISEGDDTVYLKNLRTISVEDIETETYIIRDAVSGETDDASGFTSYVPFVLGEDGYYHVVAADGTAGPLLLADMLGYTNFDSDKTVSQRVMDEGELLVGDVDMYNEWMVYANASANSAIYGCTPVTEKMRDILNAYCSYYRFDTGKAAHPELWLQLCIYYDAYGRGEDGEPTPHVKNPILGLTTDSAFKTDFPDNPEIGTEQIVEVTYDRVIMPRGFLYKFTPKTSGVYRVTSHSSEEMIGWIFTGTSLEWTTSVDGERVVLSDFEEEERYCPALNIDNGDGTFSRDMKNISLLAYMEKDKDYYIDIAYNDLYAEGTFTFDITYEGTAFDAFVMASPGPITYVENISGGMGDLIAIGIDYAFKEEDGVMYAYQVLERDENDQPTVWGNKIYADFFYPTIPFPSQSIEELAKIGAFNFAISELDRDALVMLENIRINGKNGIITKWINDGNANASTLWTEKNLDEILLLLQSGKDVSAYDGADVAIAQEALDIGVLALKRAWGIEAIGNDEDWVTYKMDEALAGTLSDNEIVRETQETVLAGIARLWTSVYKMEDVAKGIYHGAGVDETETIQTYIDMMDDGSNNVERQGCVAVTEELAEILHQLYAKYIFEDVQHDWLKFCFFYKHLGA